MLTRDEYLKKIGHTDESLLEKGLEVVFIGEVGYLDGDDDGWDTYYIPPKNCLCGTVHTSL
jgi:hypothetical protein